MVKFFFLKAGVMLVYVACIILSNAPLAEEYNFHRTGLIVSTQSGKYIFDVEIADTPDLRRQGLQFRDKLGAFEGMLFDFVDTQPVYMWMKNTKLPLDMVFVGKDWRVRNIIRETEPFSLVSLNSLGPVRFVLELRAGTASRIGLRPDDKIKINK